MGPAMRWLCPINVTLLTCTTANDAENALNSMRAHAADAKKPGISRLIHDNTFYSAVTPADDVRPPRLSLGLGLLQIAKELATWVKDQHIAFTRKAFTVGPQAAIEGVKLLIQTVGLGVDGGR